MKRIKYIAANELYALFFSPIAWLLMIVFVVLTSADFIGVLDTLMTHYQQGGWYLSFCRFMTFHMTASPRDGVIFGVVRNVYIFLPLITMGLISREMNSGTIKLLQSSPLRTREIVLGKFLAMLGFIVCLLVLTAIILIPLSMWLSHPDYSQIAMSFVGLFFVLSTYAAIGLFISSLTTYQIVAAIGTFAAMLLLSRASDLGQDIRGLRDITYYMNIGGKSGNMLTGLLSLRDLTYFIIIICGFLAFTIIKIKSGAESISRGKKALRYLTVIAIGFVLAYITNKPSVNVYHDFTRGERLTITPPTQAMLAKLNDGPLNITVYCNLFFAFDRFNYASQLDIEHSVWERYIRFKPDINLKFVYYYDLDTSNWRFKDKATKGKSLRQMAEKEAKAQKISLAGYLSPAEVNKELAPLTNTTKEECRSFFVLRYKEKATVLHVFDDQIFWPGEDEVSASINRMVGTPPKIGFVQGDIERGLYSQRPRDYVAITSLVGSRNSLLNQGYDFDTFNLKNKDIPQGLAALAIADPRVPMPQASLDRISRYIDEGGNLFLACEPDRAEVTKPLMDKLGLSLRPGMLIQPSKQTASNEVFPYMTNTTENLTPQVKEAVADIREMISDFVFKAEMSGVGAMNYHEKDGFHIYPLMLTDSALAWNRVAPISSDSLQLEVKHLPSDERGHFVTAVRMNRNINGKDQRIFVTSDADFISKDGVTHYFNFSFGFACFAQYSYGQFPTNTKRPRSIDNRFSTTNDSIGPLKIILYWVLPGLIALMASLILVRRKRK